MTIEWATMIPLIGGSAIGCSQATGTKPAFHLSYDAFKQNESHLQAYWPDVVTINLDHSPLPRKRVDFVNSVCPCAGLSSLSTKKDCAKNEWMLKTSELVLEGMRPKVLWGENAPALFTDAGTDVRESLARIANKHGYSFSLYKTSTCHHGIPQKRLRTFYFFWDAPSAPEMQYYDRPHKPFHEYIMDIPEGASGHSTDTCAIKNIFEYSPVYTQLLKDYRLTHQQFCKKYGDNEHRSLHWHLARSGDKPWSSSGRKAGNSGLLQDYIEFLERNHQDHKELRDLRHAKKKLDMGLNFMSASPLFHYDITTAIVGRTLFQGMHPIYPRSMTFREIMHMMGMPHNFKLVSKNINDVAQNVPVPTARDMALEVIEFINGNRKLSGHAFLKQDNTKKQIVEAGTLEKFANGEV